MQEEAPASVPCCFIDTVLDDALVALSPDGRPNFNLVQNFKSAQALTHYYAFDIFVHKNKDVPQLPLSKRREIL
ncbi:hypothetical protein [Tunturiibacter psychrotolerans]|uniref:hypothetical protein n=1 Tax=Tunturiibacter psychrotolerans TaxID=3069686 RepID=UPI003D23F38E